MIGQGPGLEVFEITGEQRAAAGLADFGANHMAAYCDDIAGSLARLVAAGGQALSEVHGNSRHVPTNPKSASGVRSVPIPPHIVADLRHHLEHWAQWGAEGLVFPPTHGGADYLTPG